MYQVGDKVRIREDLCYDSAKYYPVGINFLMVELAGQEAEITEVMSSRGRLDPDVPQYLINADRGENVWIDTMLELPVTHDGEDLYKVWGDIECSK